MAKRIGVGAIILIVYASIFVIFYAVIPFVFNRSYPIQGFIPFIFFFPFFLGRRGSRSRYQNQNQNAGSSSPQQSPEDILNEQYDTSGWEKTHAKNYDEYGIRMNNSTSRYWYYIGVVIIVAVATMLLLLKGSFLNL